MRTGNHHIIVYNSTKFLKRLHILAVKGVGKDKDKDHTIFIANLLIAIKEWGYRFPKFDGKSSPYKVKYDDLVNKKVRFPVEEKPLSQAR
jgi:hypothetical protein